MTEIKILLAACFLIGALAMGAQAATMPPMHAAEFASK